MRFGDGFEKVFREHHEGLEKREQRIRGMEAKLSHPKELLATRTTKPAGAQSALAVADSKSEVGVFINKTIELRGTGVYFTPLSVVLLTRREHLSTSSTVRLGHWGSAYEAARKLPIREDSDFENPTRPFLHWGRERACEDSCRGCAPQHLKPQTDSDLDPRQASGCRYLTPNSCAVRLNVTIPCAAFTSPDFGPHGGEGLFHCGELTIVPAQPSSDTSLYSLKSEISSQA